MERKARGFDWEAQIFYQHHQRSAFLIFISGNPYNLCIPRSIT